jgi:hypothetical protein
MKGDFLMADQTPAPAAIPWYRAAVLQSLLVIVFTQVLARVAAHFHIDVAALSALGIDPNALTQWTLDGISALAIAYAAHGRISKPLPAITTTPTKADAINASAASPPAAAPPVSQPPTTK